MTLFCDIIFVFKKKIVIYIDYIIVSNKYNYLFSTIYTIVINIMINVFTFRSTFLYNFTNRLLKIYKKIRLKTIYKYIDNVHFIINFSVILKIFILTINVTIFIAFIAISYLTIYNVVYKFSIFGVFINIIRKFQISFISFIDEKFTIISTII